MKPRPPGIIDYALLDLIDFKQEGVTDVLVNGWWPHRCPLFARFKFQAGGRPLKIGDENATVLGHELATKLGKAVGDKIQLYGDQQFRIVGIFESPLAFENNGLVVPLKDMQGVMDLPQEITGFAITAERPIDEKGLEDMRERLEAVQPGLEVKLLRRSGNDQSPKAQPDSLAMRRASVHSSPALRYNSQNEGLKSLLPLTGLWSLWIGGTGVTDAGLATLQPLPLQYLDITNTQITDAGLATLKSFPALKHLEAANSKTTDAGIQELQRARPNITINR